MVELDTTNLINTAKDDEIKRMLFNIDTYKDMDDYTHYNCITEKDFIAGQENGDVLDITMTTYNGAPDKTKHVSELTTANIYSALLKEVHEYYFRELLKNVGEDNTSESRQVRLLTEVYNVFTIGQHLYIGYDWG